MKLFNANTDAIDNVLRQFPREKDLNVLASHVLSVIE